MGEILPPCTGQQGLVFPFPRIAENARCRHPEGERARRDPDRPFRLGHRQDRMVPDGRLPGEAFDQVPCVDHVLALHERNLFEDPPGTRPRLDGERERGRATCA